MRVREVAERLGLETTAGERGLDKEVIGGYCGDLLSDVMANAREGDLWLTIQSHKNIVGVAVLRDIAAVLLMNGRQPEEDTRAKADEQGIPILVCPQPAFETAGLLYQMGVRRSGG